MAATSLAYANERRDDRHEVHFRTSARIADRELALTIVNVSVSGLMARCDAALASGDLLSVRLPGQPPIEAVVRWALGGRIGCEFAAAIPPARYFPMLARLGG